MPSRQIREESWNSLHRSEASGDNVNDDLSMGDDSDSHSERSTTESPTFPTISDVQRALHPLQATADRVGKQVERFAENLDRLGSRKQQKASKDCSHALRLVDAYKKISTETIQHLETMHAPERRQQQAKKTKRKLRKSSEQSTPGRTSSGDDKEQNSTTTINDLNFWEQEEQTWDLLYLMLQVEYPLPEPARSQKPPKGHTPLLSRPHKDIPIHRYSSEKDVWNKFLGSDDQAWERHVVLEWLKKCADQNGQDIALVVQELDMDADRGSGLWAHSWLYSKEAIKGQKRLRSWPKALEPDSPGLDASLMNSEKTEALITQLDPDAITRQGRCLEKQDQYFERATWLACWEMLRRGKDWEDVREWCGERVEHWRAIAMHGDPRSILPKPSSAAGWQSRALWRKACALAAKDGGIDEYENAVYGALSGYLPSVQQVSRSWDDYLFAHYNSYLLHSFDRFVQTNFPNRVPAVLTDQQSSFNFSTFGGQRLQSGNQIIEKMKHLDATKQEAQSPVKMLQGSIIARAFDEFVFKHGIRLAKSANADGNSKILKAMDSKILEESITAPISMTDHDLLRLVTHVILIYQDLGYDFGKGDRLHAMENIIVAYVDYLSKAGKQQLLPLYAARLSPERSIACLGRQLPSILDRGERQTFMSLMAQEGVDVPAVLSTQLIMIIADTPVPENNPKAFPKPKILEDADKDVSIPRQIRKNFIGDSMTDDQEDLVHGFEWYLLLEGHWRETMLVGAVVYKHLLRKYHSGALACVAETDGIVGSRGLAAARLLSQTVSFSEMSFSKTKRILGRATDISKSDDLGDGDGEVAATTTRRTRSRHASSQRRRRSSSLRRANNAREIMLDQATTYRDLEGLIMALDALEAWKAVADKCRR